ncbi:hypothetical protein DRE_03438 [Drechslerella stenobrocha 248]|uniref:Uncharacterized protein n=1 Tax=Drechslerella stenobrocha 248 TaxID=1043628 RepID=W7HUC1_9PEZI|nr:hypothetical protein DRE_03438 [Drechslerella stenobrocha 248]
MGFSAVTVAVTVYSVSGMIAQGRSNRSGYAVELQKEQQRQWMAWRAAEIEEMVTAGMDREQAAVLFDESEEKRRRSKTAWGRITTWAYGGLTPSEETYMSRYELHDGRIQKQVFQKLQKEFYESRGLELPKRSDDELDQEEEEAERRALAAVTTTAAAVDGIVPTVPAADVKAVEEAVKSQAKGYWGTLRSLFTGGRM